jgi:hypothetical protein
MAQIEFDLIGKFGDDPLDSFDKFMLQTHLNNLADHYCQDRVKQARSYLDEQLRLWSPVPRREVHL